MQAHASGAAPQLLDGTSLTFERATVDDAAALLDLEQRVAVPKLYEPRVKIEDAIKEIQANTFYFVRHRDGIIGTASFRLQDDGSAYIGNMAVDPVYRRRGVARATMNFLIGQLGHAVRLELVTHPANEHALRLYASLAFKIEAEISSYFGDGEPRVKLVRWLNAVRCESGEVPEPEYRRARPACCPIGGSRAA